MTDKPDDSDFLDDPELEELLVKARTAFDKKSGGPEANWVQLGRKGKLVRQVLGAPRE